MIRKWLIFALSAGILVTLGIARRIHQCRRQGKGNRARQDHGESEQAQLTLTKGLRTKVLYAKNAERRRDERQGAGQTWPRLPSQSRTPSRRPRTFADAGKKWDDWSDAFIKTAEALSQLAAKPNSDFKKTKDAFTAVKKSCADCHQDFRVDAVE